MQNGLTRRTDLVSGLTRSAHPLAKARGRSNVSRAKRHRKTVMAVGPGRVLAAAYSGTDCCKGYYYLPADAARPGGGSLFIFINFFSGVFFSLLLFSARIIIPSPPRKRPDMYVFRNYYSSSGHRRPSPPRTRERAPQANYQVNTAQPVYLYIYKYMYIYTTRRKR